MQAYLKIVLLSCVMVVLGSLMTSCTVMYNVPKESIKFSATNKINIRVALRLDDSLCNAKWEKAQLGTHVILPIGSALCINAESLARALFTKVTVLKDKAVPLPTNVDAVIIPSLASIERDRPATIFSTQTTSILFSWSLNDMAGDPIWMTTIEGEGKGPMGQPFERDAGRKQIEMVLDDIFQKSLREMSSSPLIREFAANRHKSNP